MAIDPPGLRWRSAGAPRPASLLRALAAVALAVAIGLGCTLETSGLPSPDSLFRCTATLRSPDGALDTPDSSMDPYAASICGADETVASGEWRRRLFEVVSTDPSVAPMGFSCAEDVVCGEPTPLPEGVACPAGRSGTELPDCGALGARCLDLQPTTTDAGFDARVDFPTGTVGVRSAPMGATIRNTCSEPVRLFVEEALGGRDEGDFGVASTTCAPDPSRPDEAVLGKALAAGDTCSIEFYFEPTEVRGFATARQNLTQDTLESYAIRLFASEILP